MTIDLHSQRAQKARLGRRIGQLGYTLLRLNVVVMALLAAGLFWRQAPTWGYLTISWLSLSLVMAIWYRFELRDLPSDSRSFTNQLHHDILARLRPNQPITPLTIWQALHNHGQAFFLTNHLLLADAVIVPALSDDPAGADQIWQTAQGLAKSTNSPSIEVGHVITALLLETTGLQPYFQHTATSPTDITNVVAWLDRTLATNRSNRPYFGGIGRDWANGFTPRLNQFGRNISLEIESQGAYFGWLSTAPGVLAMKNAFSQDISSLALIGEAGVGKTSHVQALAQVLLQEQHDPQLEHRQIISLSPAQLLAVAQRPGDMEQLLLLLLNETAHASNIILFFDDARLFFENGVGSVDISQVLLPIVQNRSIQMIFALTPTDYQRLKANQASLANLLTPITIQEPSADQTRRILEDTALNLEHHHQVLVSYTAVTEAYLLSGRYNQDTAYPGKAIQLLEQAIGYADQQIVTNRSVQRAVEQSRGVKVGQAGAVEADQLLNLEAQIHQRMINQSHAVSVVANALRRARAGVANRQRPIGSFLFLGPTGVGKTELAKAIAATFFGAETNLIRLDMSEYQQPDDVQRLLRNDSGLILAVRQQPYSVVLLDEIEKAHPNILNLLLQLLDEGQLTDGTGRPVSFKDCVIIATSNAGAQSIRAAVAPTGDLPADFESHLTDELISSNQFKPELLNRFDEIVLFRPLNQAELSQVVGLMLQDINRTLQTQNITVSLTPAATAKIVAAGYDARLGARPLRRVLQRTVEDSLAKKILDHSVEPGATVTFDVDDLAV